MKSSKGKVKIEIRMKKNYGVQAQTKGIRECISEDISKINARRLMPVADRHPCVHYFQPILVQMRAVNAQNSP
jgi:hypothetical protein